MSAAGKRFGISSELRAHLGGFGGRIRRSGDTAGAPRGNEALVNAGQLNTASDSGSNGCPFGLEFRIRKDLDTFIQT